MTDISYRMIATEAVDAAMQKLIDTMLAVGLDPADGPTWRPCNQALLNALDAQVEVSRRRPREQWQPS